VPAISTPVGPAPMTTKVSHSAPRLVRLALGLLERQQHAPADVDRVVQRLEAGGMTAPLLVAEIGVGGARGQDEEVVRHLPVAEDQALVAEVDSGGIGQEDGRVALPAQDVAQGRRDVRRGEAGGGHLVQERLEDVMVVAVDERDLDGRMAQRARRGEAGEAPADDDDARSRGRPGIHRFEEGRLRRF
jgi:hypothetical protein